MIKQLLKRHYIHVLPADAVVQTSNQSPRLSLSSTGKVRYTLKTPYRDGTTQVAFDGAAIRPVDFIASLMKVRFQEEGRIS